MISPTSGFAEACVPPDLSAWSNVEGPMKPFSRMLCSALLSTSILAGCTHAHADRSGWWRRPPAQALSIAPERVRAPYDVSIVGENGATLETYAKGGRYYLLGSAGERYVIRVSNPTPRRVEAVVTVDGLDVIDGEGGDMRKRGYVIQPYGDLEVEGFRTSTSDVATFRFSSVGNSYAGRKGKARNVGVIAVALFEEQGPPPPPVIVDDDYPRPYPHDYPYGGSPSAEHDGRAGQAPARKSEAAPSPRANSSADLGAGAPAQDEAECCGPPRNRPGLGTEFGEQRYSAAQYTQFRRASNRPVAVAELRYNDARGLAALGIPLYPVPDGYELSIRETANPFPGGRFARPPAGIR